MAKSPDFVHLHNHYDRGSILDGFGQPREYVQRAAELKMKGLGISDHGTLNGVYSFMKLCEALDITAIPGCEMYVAPLNPEGARVKEPVFYGKVARDPKGRLRPTSPNDVSGSGAYTHLSTWAVSRPGLSNLYKLSTLSWQEEHTYQKNRIDFSMLEDHSEGLVVSTGCPSSEVSTRLLLGQEREAYEFASRLKDVFGDRVFVEVMNHSMSIDLERRLLPLQVKLSKDLGIPLLATNDCHYVFAEDAKRHEEMLALQSGSRMADPTYDEGGSRFSFNGNEYYLKSAAEMAEVFPEAEYPGALKNSLLIAEMAQGLTLPYDPSLKPRFNPPEGHTEISYFKARIKEGFQWRYGESAPEVQQEAQRRINEEFKVIHSSDFVGYFLVVDEYLKWAKEKFSTRNEEGKIIAESIGPGRGSVGGSVIAFVLGISSTDPIRHNLLFERFLSAGRGDVYRVTYDDGTFEDVVVSTEREVITTGDSPARRYIHQLKLGDTVMVEDDALKSLDDLKTEAKEVDLSFLDAADEEEEFSE